jgi:hypothetical protein
MSPETIDELGVIFLDVKSCVLREIPENLCSYDFSIYVVVNRLSKTNARLNFRDSEGWLSIVDREIEEATGFDSANVCLLGYIRDPTKTNVFRNVLTFNHSKHRPVKPPARSVTFSSLQDVVPSKNFQEENRISIVQAPDFVRPMEKVTVIIWRDVEDSPWSSQIRV